MTKVSNEKLIVPSDNNLTLDEIGILSLMLNCIEYDYCSKDDLYEASPKDNKKIIDKTISELCKKGYLVELQKNCFAFNKHKITSLRLIGR